MDQPIEISYLWDADQFVRVKRALQKHLPSRFVRGLIPILISVYLLIGCLLMAGPLPFPIFGVMLLVVSLFGIQARYLGGLDRRNRKVFRKAGVMAEPDQKVLFSVDESRIHKRTPGTESSWIWELVPTVIEARDGFVIIHAGIGHWLPLEGFLSPTDVNRFADLASRHARKYLPPNRQRRSSS